MGKGDVPNHPHLIIVPNILVEQIVREVCTFFWPSSVNIFVLPSNQDQVNEFWKERYTKSNHEPIFCIIISGQTVSLLQFTKIASDEFRSRSLLKQLLASPSNLDDVVL